MRRLRRFRSVAVAAMVLAGTAACRKDEADKDSDTAAQKVRETVGEMKEGARDLDETARDVAKDTEEGLRGAAREAHRAGDEAVDTARDVTGGVKEDLQRGGEYVADTARDVTGGAEHGAEDVGHAADRMGEDTREKMGDVADEAEDYAGATERTAESLRAFERQKSIRIASLRNLHAVAASQPLLISTVAQGIAAPPAVRAGIDERLQAFQLALDEAENAVAGLQAADATAWEDANLAATQAFDRLDTARTDAWEALDKAYDAGDMTSMREDQGDDDDAMRE